MSMRSSYNPIPAWLVVAKVAKLDAVNAPVDGDLRLAVLHLVAPVREHVAAVVGDVVLYLEHALFSLISESVSSRLVTPAVPGRPRCHLCK